MGWFIYFMIVNIQTFYKYETTTNIEDVTEEPTQFPTITICNQNIFTTDAAILAISNTINSLNKTNIFNMSMVSNLKLDKFHSDIQTLLTTTLNKILNAQNETQQKSLGHLIDDFLIECYFDNTACNSATDFIWYFDQTYGNCFRYNSGGNRTTLKESSEDGFLNLGLKLTLFDSMPNVLKHIAYHGTGFIIRIDNSSYRVEGNNQISLMSNGVETSISVKRIYTNKLPTPYSTCKIQLDSSNGFNSELYTIFKQQGTLNKLLPNLIA